MIRAWILLPYAIVLTCLLVFALALSIGTDRMLEAMTRHHQRLCERARRGLRSP